MPTPSGTICFWLTGQSCEGRLQGTELKANRNSDGTVTLKVKGPRERLFVFRQQVPPLREKPVDMPNLPDDSVYIGISWQETEVLLYLNHSLADRKPLVIDEPEEQSPA